MPIEVVSSHDSLIRGTNHNPLNSQDSTYGVASCRKAPPHSMNWHQVWYPPCVPMLEHRFAKLSACATFVLLVVGYASGFWGEEPAAPEAPAAIVRVL